MASSSAFGCQLRAGSAAVDLDLESDEEQVLPCKRLKASSERDFAERGRDEPEAKTDVELTTATRKARGHAADKALARWCALAPEKSLRGCELTIAALGATAGSRVQLRCGLVLLLRGDVPPMTAHEAVAAASALLRAGDPVAAAKALGHASPLTVDAMVQAHVRQVFQKNFQADLGELNDRDRLRLQLRRTSALPVAFRVTSATNADLQKLQGQDFKDGMDFAANPICKEKRLTASLGDCHLLSGGLMSAEQAAADDTSRAPDCVVELSMEPPFTTSFTAFPPQAHGRAGGLVYSKVHAICPDGQHRAILLGLPADCIAEEVPSDKTSKAPLSQQLSFKCSLLRRTIERGRLFGGGAAAVQEALQAILDSRDALATAAALRCLLLAMMDSVRLWKQRPEHLSFATLSMLAVLAASLPSWRPPAALRAALLRTASAAQAADQPESYMRWKTWRKPSGGGDDGRFDWTTGDDEMADIRNSLRLLTRGFLCLSAEEAGMMSCYADAMVNRGGLPIYQLPLPRADLEERLPSDYHLAAVDCSVVPHLPLHLQAALRKPPLCESTNLKDLHLRNLRFFIEQTQFNTRHQKDLKLRGGYIEAGDMERIINYMDEEHFAAGRDLAEARALPDDSGLQKSNAEGFVSEEECHLQSDRCRGLRTTLESVQRFMLAEPPKPATATARRRGGKKSSLESVLVANDDSSRLDAFLSLFGASREVKVAGDRKDGQAVRVTCARTDRLDQPLLIQRAHRSQGQAGDRDEAFQEVDETSVREAAARAYCKSFADSKCSLPLPPMGFIWTVSGPVQLRAESSSAVEALHFFVAGVELPPFDAGPVLRRCRMPSNSQSLCDEDRALLSQALYIDSRLDQVSLLAQLRSVAETLRSSPGEDAAPEWLEEALASKIPGCIWQEIYARLLLEEDFEGNPCLTLSPAHPYAGTLFRIVLLLAFLYPWVLAPTSNDLAFRVTRTSDISGSLHQHLLTVVKTLAYQDAEGRLTLAQPKAVEARVTTELFPYQKEAVERLLQSRHKGSNGSLDASSLGAGKTLVAVSFCMFLASAHGGGQFLVLVGSSSLMEGWRDQLIQHTSGVRIQLQQENGVLRDVSQRASNQAATSPGKASPGKRKRCVQDTDAETLFVITTYARAARHPFCCTWLLVVADECLALQNTDTLQCTAAWRLVSRSLYGGHFISGTMFRRHYSDLLDMLKMLRSSIPLRAEFVQAYFGAYLISYMRPQRSWQTKLVPLDIPAAVQSSYLEVVDECRGRAAQNFVKVLSRMRRVLSTAVQNDARPLAEAVWQTVQQLREEGRRPLVFASTEREADALCRHLGCARRYRRRHPAHCRGCDICRNFNKFAQPGCEKLPPVEGSEKGEELLIFTVGSDAAGLNLQSLGDSLILRPVQMDQLVQMMGRLDRPGQTSEQLCRAILYMKRTHEEAEVAHLQKHAAFWSLHIKPIARLIVMATAGAADNRQEISETYDKLLEGEQKPKAAASLEIAQAPEEEEVPNSEVWTSSENFGKRSWSTLRLAAGPSASPKPGSPAKQSPSKLAFRQVRGDLPDSSPKLGTIDLEPPMDVEQQLPRAMTRQSVQLGVGYLIQNDERFRHVVQLIGPPTGILELLGKDRPDPFTTLVQTVCHQQLSVRVCQGMFERLLGLCGNRDTKVLQPERVACESCDRIREVAKLSYRKIEYIQKIAQRFLDGTLSGEVFEEASDDELRQRLTQLPGIGEWTLEMFLIFQLHRHGGIPYGDVAIQSAMKMIYNIAPPAHITAKNEVSWMPTRPQMEIFAKRWGPFGSIASLYMLRVADNVNAVFLPD